VREPEQAGVGGILPVRSAGSEEARIRLITAQEQLADLVDRLRSVSRYALDTEFHRERTYWAAPALVQVAWEDGPGTEVALIDPLSVDLEPLGEILAGSATMVAHAAEQDLEILERVCGRSPTRLLDTQVEAGFTGHSSPSLSSLLHAYLGFDLPKADRLTDWRLRPLTRSQMDYAASDVDHLIGLSDALASQLEASGRLQWAVEECEEVRGRGHGAGDPRRAWWKLRDARGLRGASRGIAQEVAAWRERTAQTLDQPVRFVLSDLAVQSIAHRPPGDEESLARARGMEGKRLRGAQAAEVLAAVERGRRLEQGDLVLPPAEDVPRSMRASVALIMAWVAQVAREERLDAALLATRSDIAAHLRGDPSRLDHGWRAEIVAEPIRALVEGRGSLAFNGEGSLVLEERSGLPLSRGVAKA
jgi:ribonuclease D